MGPTKIQERPKAALRNFAKLGIGVEFYGIYIYTVHGVNPFPIPEFAGGPLGSYIGGEGALGESLEFSQAPLEISWAPHVPSGVPLGRHTSPLACHLGATWGACGTQVAPM